MRILRLFASCLPVVLGVTLHARVASAAAAKPAPSPPASPAARTVPQHSTAVYVYESDGAKPADAAALADELEKSLNAEPTVELRPLQPLLDGTSPEAALDAARASLKGAEDAFAQMDLDGAQPKISAAVDGFERFLPQLAAQPGGIDPLVRAFALRVKCQFFAGDKAGVTTALHRLWALDAKQLQNPKLLPPQLKKSVTEALRGFEKLGQGKLVVKSKPEGAQVFVDGEPFAADRQLNVGTHVVTFRRYGVKQQAVEAAVVAGPATAVEQQLTGVPDAIEAAKSKLTDKELPGGLADVAKAWHVEQLVLVRSEPQAGENVRWLAYLYDAASGRVSRSTALVARAPEVATAAGKITPQLLTEPAGAPVAKPVGKSFGTRVGEFRRSKWFWWVVGGAAGVVVVGAAAAVGGYEAHRADVAAQTAVAIGGR